MPGPHRDRAGPPATFVAERTPLTTLTKETHACIHLRMATKTISVDLEAYERLRRARHSPDESFSRVIKRATWPEKLRTATALLDALDGLPRPPLAVIDRLDGAQRDDTPPEDAWHNA